MTLPTLRSHFDWNEIVPLLPKAKRDDLYLEAILILSNQDGRLTMRGVRTRRRSNGHAPDTRKTSGEFRFWRQTGNPYGTLSGPGHKYTINRDAKKAPSYGKLAAVWKHMLSSKNDSITFEGIASICKGVKLEPSAAIATLWSKRAIDLVSEPATK
jgi:hypothetical protein